MISVKKKKLTKDDRKGLKNRLFWIILIKPFFNALIISLIFLLLTPFFPILPTRYFPEIATSANDYFGQIMNSIKSLPFIFLMLWIISFFFYFFSNLKLIVDISIDLIKDCKILGVFMVIGKTKERNNYYVITSNLNYPKIKVKEETFNVIAVQESIEIIIGESKRAYRYNPKLKNFILEKLI